MRKTITKIICAAAAAISVAGLALTAGCGAYTTEGVSPDTYTTVTSNGGFAVQTDEYVYFINGYELNTADNTFGKPVKGSIMRISKTDMQNRNYAAAQTVVPVVAFSGQHEAGLYVYGDRIYYATPSTARNSTGVVQSSNLEFKSSTLDGKETMSDYYFRSTSTALDYRYVEVGETVYLLYAQSESLYGEETAVTNIHSVNTATGEDTLLAYDAASYSFDESDPTNPYVYYTMGVTYRLGSANAVEEGYNQLYAVRADATEAKTYDFSYVEDYDAESNPLYVNCGDLVYDGIGMDSYNMRYNQFNYGYGGDEKYEVNRTDTEYTIGRYSDGVLFFSAQSTLDSAEGLYMLENSKVDSDGDGRVDESWNAITANDSITDYRLLIDGDDTEYNFYTANGVTYALFIDEGGLSRCTFENGERTDVVRLTDGGKPDALIAIREEVTATEDGEGTVNHVYAYYSLTGGNGYTFWRIAIDGEADNYAPNKLPVQDVYTYSEVRILDLDAYDSWYLPEFVDNTILFASKTEGMSEYTYIMACDLTSEDGDMMSNAELNAYNEQYEAVSEKIDAYDDETNSDGTAAYEHLSSALTYAFYSGDEDYIDELVQAYIDIAGEDEEYMYSKRSVEIYHEFFSATGDWADYASLSRKVDGQTVYANMQKYYYSLIGKMSESDYDEMIDGLRSSYMQDYPVDDTTWWDSMGLGWQIVFCIAMCVAGLVVIGGVTVLVVWLVRRNKNKKVEGGSARAYVDITDDKNIDVYDGGENE